MMIKEPEFWQKVAKDVCIAANAMNSQVPLWEDLDEPGRASMVLICQFAVRSAASRGRAELPYEPEPDVA